jgi:hypothetical protein
MTGLLTRLVALLVALHTTLTGFPHDREQHLPPK